MKKKILISTGGSGGHVIPATILYDHLKDDFDVFITLDNRGKSFLNLKKYNYTIINTPKLFSNIIFLPFNIFLFVLSIFKSLYFLKKSGINILISTGGYMSLPLCISSLILGIDIYLFEPNMVLGKSNRIFLKYSKKIFCYSRELLKYPKQYLNKISTIEPLLRKEFYSLKGNNSNQLKDEINLLIIGGSQGAKLFDDELKISLLKISQKYKLNVYQQAIESNHKMLKDFYEKNNINYKIFNFEQSIFKTTSNINLCITRAGASALSELTFLNIPFLAIPLPSAKDDHQYQNALQYKKKNCCWIIKQHELKNEILINNLINIIENKEDYLAKKKCMKEFSYKNTWNNINEKLIGVINEN